MIAEAQFNRATLDCMTALRRQLKRTLGVTIRLGDPDAVEEAGATQSAGVVFPRRPALLVP